MPEGSQEGILKGMYLLREAGEAKGPRVQLLGSGTILREVIAGADLLAEFGVSADIWSCPSFTELRREGLEAERWNMLNPEQPRRRSYVEQCLDGREGPVVGSTDYMKAFADQIRPFVKARYHVLGTDGFGRSDYRRKLRSFFEIDRRFVSLAALKSLADEGKVQRSVVSEAIRKFEIDPERPSPVKS